MMDWNLLVSLAGLVGALIASIFGASVWFNRQFSSMKDFVYGKHEELKTFIIDKLEYHERHDDSRFTNVQNSLLAIQLRNAAIDGKTRREIEDERSIRG